MPKSIPEEMEDESPVKARKAEAKVFLIQLSKKNDGYTKEEEKLKGKNLIKNKQAWAMDFIIENDASPIVAEPVSDLASAFTSKMKNL